jgi:hypothetical protein
MKAHIGIRMKVLLGILILRTPHRYEPKSCVLDGMFLAKMQS